MPRTKPNVSKEESKCGHLFFRVKGLRSIGMGKELAAVAYPAAKAVFEEVDDALGQDLSGLIWDGDIEYVDP